MTAEKLTSDNKQAAIIKSLCIGETIEVLKSDAKAAKDSLRKEGIIVKIFNSFKSSPTTKIKVLWKL
jgi:hypothetical protein